MPGSREDLSPAIAIEAIEQNLFAFMTATGGWPGMEVHDEPDLLWTISDIPFPAFNVVCRARLVETDTGRAIETAIARAQDRQVPLSWITGPSTQPSNLPELLLQHGFLFEERVPGMVCDLRLPPPELASSPRGLSIELVADDAAIDRWSATCAVVGELPDFAAAPFAALTRQAGYGGPTYHYLGYLDGAPVATLTLFLAAGAAGLYDGGTVEGARGQGVFAALMRTAMRLARDRGYRFAVLQATEMSVGQIRRLGFQEVCTISQYVWEPEAG